MTVKKTYFSPSDFMRGRRSEQFSDSRIEDSWELDKDFLEYKLESITSRSEEKQFEHLARKLAERLICPNLVPQTGPTGGGDSKVDTETFPVHEDISTLWYEGNVEAADERWGFAVSAKKKWQGKIRSDMQSIASTKRGYKVAYFVSNQFISDKIKSKWQDELSKEHGFDVRILDRTWLLEAIVDKNNQEIAIHTLNLSTSIKKKLVGPKDYAKQQALDEIENLLTKTDRYSGVEFQLVEDSIAAAILSRELEVDRHLTDGKHERSIRLARLHGTQNQVVDALYQKAWTSVYWHDDFSVLLEVYGEIEKFALDSRNTVDVEKAINLWQTLHTAVINKALTSEESQIVERATCLIQHLDSIREDEDRPNNAANATWLKLGIQIVQSASSIVDDAERDRLLGEYGELIVNSQHLGGFEFDRAYEYFEIMETPFGALEVYDELFEKLLPIIESRKTDIVVADKLFNRGIDKLRNGQAFEAIDFLGRALPMLIKAEKQERLVRCLVALASAYSSIDLYWAAHTNHMSALSILVVDFEKTNVVDALLPMLLEKMFWGEVSVGRVSHALWLLEFQLSVLRQTGLDAEDEEFKEDFLNKDGVLAMLLLKANDEQLEELRGLVNFFENNGLMACAMALVFSFGGPENLRRHEFIQSSESDESIWETMEALWDQPAQAALPECIETYGSSKIHLVSNLLGTSWNFTCENNPWCVRIGESYLGFLEAFLSTSIAHDAVGLMEKAHVHFQLVAEGAKCPNDMGLELRIGSGSNLATVVVWPESFPIGSLRTQKLRDFFIYSLVNILPRVLHSKDNKKLLETIADSENGLPRSLMFADVLSSASNIYVDCESPSLTKWAEGGKQYKINQKPSCNIVLKTRMELQRKEKKGEMKFGDGEPREEFIDTVGRTHGSQKILSVIDLDLWNKAIWDGVGIAFQQGGTKIPLFLGLIFREKEAGLQIFKDWIADIGRTDSNEKIRVVILTGVQKSNPNAYTLSISSRMDRSGISDLDMVLITSKMKTMDNPDPKNLSNFQRIYGAMGQYQLIPVTVNEDGGNPEFHFDYSITKTEITIREAWTVGLNDPDCSAIAPDINPIIPTDEDSPPIIKLLDWIKQNKKPKPPEK